MTRVTVLALGTLLIAGIATGRDSRKELRVDLKFAPQESVGASSPDITPGALEKTMNVRVEDARGPSDSATIGQGTNDDDVTFPIVASTDVVAHVSNAIQQFTEGWGIKRGDRPDRILTLRLARFFVDESNKAVGSVYAAEVKISYVLEDAAGTKLIEGAASGSAHRYGRARSSENCNEVLSDALKDAVANVIGDLGLQDAWATGRGPARSAERKVESVEERLRKLDELLEKKLITREEYAKKRAEILKDI